MVFEEGQLYHIFNQGINRQKVFFQNENYLFFIRKVREYMLPYADILAWCLMPNHFHFMVYINKTSLKTAQRNNDSDFSKNRTLNESIGIMVRSYVRAVNIQEKRTGALFREKTKAICLTKINEVTRAWFNTYGATQINLKQPESMYPAVCFNYINFNPLKDGLVKDIKNWEFSSYLDVTGNRNGTLINKARIEEFGLELIQPLSV